MLTHPTLSGWQDPCRVKWDTQMLFSDYSRTLFFCRRHSQELIDIGVASERQSVN